MTTVEYVDGGKALPVEETEKGDLILRGYAAVWHGEDRQGDAFSPGAFDRAIEDFLSSQATLLYHHRRDRVLGRVLELVPDDYGLKIKARVDAAVANDPDLGLIYKQVQRGTINGVSVGGRFTRSMVAGKPVIRDVDLQEVSLTAQPQDRRPRILQIEQKAMFDADSPQAQLVALGRRVEYLGVAVASFCRVLAGRSA